MKKYLFPIVILLSSSILCAQEVESVSYDMPNFSTKKYDNNFLYKNEISASYGLITTPEFLDMFTSIFAAMFTIKDADASYSGAISRQYIRNFNRTIGFGAAVCYENISKDGTAHFIWDKESERREQDCKANEKYNYIAIMPVIKIRWFNAKCVSMYSKVAAGFTIANIKQTAYNYQESTLSEPTTKTSTDTATEFAFQLTPVAIEAGSPRVRAFAEIGFGQQGVFNLGLRCGL